VKLKANNDETWDLCIVNSETKNVEEDKSTRVSKIRNDANSVTFLAYDKSVTVIVDEGFSETGEKELHVSDTTKANNDISITNLDISDTSVSKLHRSSSRNKIRASRSSDFLW
jgi:GMP synthase PP-ATPase subunit